MKKDLGEFGDAITSEAKHVAEATASVLREQANALNQIVAEEDSVVKTDESVPEQSNDAESGGDRRVETVDEHSEQVATGGYGYYAASAGKLVKSLVDTVNKALVIEDTTVGEEDEVIAIGPSGQMDRAKVCSLQTVGFT